MDGNCLLVSWVAVKQSIVAVRVGTPGLLNITLGDCMNFQDKLKANFQTKEDAENGRFSEQQAEALQYARIVLAHLKEQLLSATDKGEYVETADGKRVVSCICPLSEQMQFHLKLEKNITTTPAVPTMLDRQLSQMIGKSRKECRRIANQYRGIDLSSGGKPAESHCRYYFSINDERLNEFTYFYEKLIELAQADGIEVEICIYDSFYNTFHTLPIEIVDEWRDKFHYKLAINCQCSIPEKYSSDVPAVVEIDTVSLNNDDTAKVASISIDAMDGHIFEGFCADILRKNGFSDVSVTKGSGDQGIDIIAFKDGIKYGIQCKCYSSDIGNGAVQEAFSGKTYYKCHVGAVLTNRYFTRSAKELAENNGILLWDRTYLLDLIEKANVKVIT